MDAYSPEDAAGDLTLDVDDARPAHELATPGAWRWLAPLSVGATFVAAVAISVFAQPEPASLQLPEPQPGLSAPDHVEPWLERVTAVEAPPTAQPTPDPSPDSAPSVGASPTSLAAAAPMRSQPHPSAPHPVAKPDTTGRPSPAPDPSAAESTTPAHATPDPVTEPVAEPVVDPVTDPAREDLPDIALDDDEVAPDEPSSDPVPDAPDPVPAPAPTPAPPGTGT